MPDPEFRVSQFKNRNGVTSWRVSGWLAGVRIRKNFRSRTEAAAEKGTLDIQAAQLAAGVRTAATFLTDLQIREAESAFRRLEGRPHGLSTYLDFAFANFREPVVARPVAEAIAAYLAKKRREHERDLLSTCQLNNIVREFVVFQKAFPGRSLHEFTANELITYCERNEGSLKSYNIRRAILATFFKFAKQQDWIEANPIDKVPHHRIAHRRGMAVTLSAARSAELMEHVETIEGGALVPYFALCLFAGIRPHERHGEIAKLRPEHIRGDTGVILIEPEVSKVRMPRRVAIQPNLTAWLRAYPFTAIDPYVIEHHRGKIVERFGLTHDVMRHTFISMHVAKFRSMGEAALQAGNSEGIIRKHYLDLKTKEEAEAFFSIMPKHRTISEAAPAPVPFQLPDQPPDLAKAG